jgi:hypothetical protein
MHYKKINLELIVPADESDPFIAEPDSALDGMRTGTLYFAGN